MRTSARAAVSFLAVLALLGVGCGPASDGSAPGSPLAGSGDCDNPYLPLRDGHSIAYATHAAGVDGTMTMSVSGVTPDGATLTYDIGSVRTTTQLHCDHGTLRATATLEAPGLQAVGQTRTVSASGTFLPPDLSPGMTWDATAQTEVTMQLPAAVAQLNGGGTAMDVTSDIATHYEVLSEEPVTVPAGTYQAAKVRTTVTTTSHGGLPGMDRPMTLTTTEWFVRDVGVVKTTDPDGNVATEATAVSG